MERHPDRDGTVFVADHGEVDLWSAGPSIVVTRARAEGCEALVIEASAVGMTPVAAHGLGEANGVWKWLWRTGGAQRSVVVEVYPSTWRAAVLGGSGLTTEEWKAEARRHVRNTASADTGSDAADAICLGEYALASLDVADAIGVRRLGQLGWSEPRGCWSGGRWVPAGEDGDGR